MANYYGVTISEGGKIKPKNKRIIKEITKEWHFAGEGEITININDNLEIYGYGDIYIYPLEKNGTNIDYNNDITEQELKKLCPYMETPLIIRSVGNEKCRYVGAFAWIISKNGIETASLDEDINRKLKKNQHV